MLKHATRQRLELIIESPLLEKVIEEITDCGAKGYTVLRGHAGLGERGQWQEGQISAAQHMMMVIVIVEQEVAEAILERIGANFELYSGVVTMSEVKVLRPQRF